LYFSTNTISVDIVGEGWEGNAEDFNLYYKTGFMNMKLNEKHKHVIQNIEKPLNLGLLLKIEQLCS
jgi:hypothetical protein